MNSLLLALPLLFAVQETAPPPGVLYAVDATKGLEGRLSVTMKIENPPSPRMTVAIPVWAPGSYRLQNFYKNLDPITAKETGKGAKIEVTAVDEQSWQVATGGAKSVTLSYDVKLDKRNYAETWCDAIGPACFLYIKDRKGLPCSTTYTIPKGWTVATGLDAVDGVYSARDYDTFIDAPAMMGFLDVLEFDELGTKYQLANAAPPPTPEDFGLTFEGETLEVVNVKRESPASKAGFVPGNVIRIVDGVKVSTFADLSRRAPKLFSEQKLDLEVEPMGGASRPVTLTLPARIDGNRMIDVHRKIVHATVAMYGGKAPFDRYVFLVHLKDQPGGGGLEHLNSSHITISYTGVRQDPSRMAGLDSHEFVHSWNVKRIRPFELGPFDYTKAVPSKQLWLCEGVTSYYGDLAMARTGIHTEDAYFRHLVNVIDGTQDNPDRLKRSVEDFAEKVWTRPTGYYYTKGEILGALLDLKIRTLTKNGKSMDDVMRHLYATYVTGPAAKGKGPIGVGFPSDGILKALNEVSGHDFSDFYKRYISGTEELPYPEVFSGAGLAYSASLKKVALGLPMRGGRVGEIEPDSDAQKAGFKEGDRIFEIAGQKVERSTMDGVIQALEAGKPVKVKVRRGEDSEEVELTITPKVRDFPGVTLKRAEKPTELQKRIIDMWLAPID